MTAADEGISGTRADKRDEFQRMIRDCRRGKIDYIITKSVSRFARNTAECIEYVRQLKLMGIGIIFEEQNIDTLKCDSELLMTIHAGFAQAESESMSRNITWSYRKRFESGAVMFNYSKLLGYRKGEDGQPEIVPEEAEVIRSIYDMFLSGMTLREISGYLKSEGIKTKGGSTTWSIAVIQNILKNEKYSGDAITQKTVTIDCISKTRKRNTGEAPCTTFGITIQPSSTVRPSTRFRRKWQDATANEAPRKKRPLQGRGDTPDTHCPILCTAANAVRSIAEPSGASREKRFRSGDAAAVLTMAENTVRNHLLSRKVISTLPLSVP